MFQHGGRYELNGETMKASSDFADESTKDLKLESMYSAIASVVFFCD